MPFITAGDSVYLYYTDQGQGDPIVLIHGWTMNHKVFQHNVDVLGRTNRVITLDIRGHGHSGKQEMNWTLEQAATDLETLLNHLDLSSVTLVGWSMGTTIIHNYFDQFGYDKIKGAVFIDMTPCLFVQEDWEHGAYGKLNPRSAYMFKESVYKDRLAVQTGNIPALFQNAQIPDEATAEFFLREAMLTPTSTMIAFWVSMVFHDWRPQLPEIKVPILLCYADKSAVYPTSLGQYLNETIPDSTLVTFENSGHALFWEEPDKFNAAVAAFVNSP
jgi:pimeloyl-ACP methyl ester carboxylesterase